MLSIACAEFPMGLHSRPMEPKDVAECAEIIAKHPVIGPRYGERIKDLRPAWLRLLDCEAKATAVLEELSGARATICFIGVAVFVGDDFVREIKTPPLAWIGPELANRIVRGNSPLLTEKQLREANSSSGLNTITWHGCIRPGFEKRAEIYHKCMSMFLEAHRGYRWKEAIANQMETVERLEWTLKTGGLIWNAAEGGYVESLEKLPQQIIREPHIVGVTRELERRRPGTWVGALFDYHPPQIVFSRCEQRLLLAALRGRTDEELGDELAVSLATVKNMWRSIHNRAASCLPELFTDRPQEDLENSHRGKEKRRRLLAYLRECPEELRPVSRRLLQQATVRRTVQI